MSKIQKFPRDMWLCSSIENGIQKLSVKTECKNIDRFKSYSITTDSTDARAGSSGSSRVGQNTCKIQLLVRDLWLCRGEECTIQKVLVETELKYLHPVKSNCSLCGFWTQKFSALGALREQFLNRLGLGTNFSRRHLKLLRSVQDIIFKDFCSLQNSVISFQ